MSNQTYALVDNSGNVIDLIVWDGVTPYTLPFNATLVTATTGAAIGGTYVNGVFTPPAATQNPSSF